MTLCRQIHGVVMLAWCVRFPRCGSLAWKLFAPCRLHACHRVQGSKIEPCCTSECSPRLITPQSESTRQCGCGCAMDGITLQGYYKGRFPSQPC